MTNKEKLQILRDREERAYELLRKLEPTDPAFGTCLDNSYRCMYVRSEIVMADVDESLCGEGVGPAPEAEQEITDIREAHELPEEGTDACDPAPAQEPETEQPKPEEGTDACDPAPAQEPETKPETEQPKPEAKEEAAAPATNDAPQLTKEDMVNRLTPISLSHPNVVQRAMAEMGFSKLSQIPAERYGELLDKVEEAVRCRQYATPRPPLARVHAVGAAQ